MAGRRTADGRSVRVTIPQSTTIPQGNFTLRDGFLGYCPVEVVTGAGQTAVVALVVEPAEYETNQILATDAFALGAKVYWDNANNRFTTTAAGNRFAGVVTSAKDGNNYIWFRFTPNLETP